MSEYNWKHWISEANNRKLYDENPQQALREYGFQLSKRQQKFDYYKTLNEVANENQTVQNSVGIGGNTFLPVPHSGYGLLYNWFASADSRGIAPIGFRIPTESDYDDIINNFTAEELRAVSPIWDGTNSSMLNLYPSGIKNTNGSFGNFTNGSFNWASNDDGDDAEVWGTAATSTVAAVTYDKNVGATIRCVSSNEPGNDVIEDASGNVYSWIKIGSLYWLQQALKTTRYNNTDEIITNLSTSDWGSTSVGAWDYTNGDRDLLT